MAYTAKKLIGDLSQRSHSPLAEILKCQTQSDMTCA